MRLKVGVVGLGPTWHSRYRPALGALRARYEVRAICDPVAHLAHQAAEELEARPIDGFRALAAADDIDAVMMLSGRWYGALPILAACDAGKAIFCGASVEMGPDDATRLQSRLRRSGVAFMAELPFRLAPATTRLKELIATRLGQPRLLFCNERHTEPACAPEPCGRQPASHTRRLIEMVDWCRYVADREPTSVQCVTHEGRAAAEADDYSLVTLGFGEAEEDAERRPVLAQIACGGYVPAGWTEAAGFRRPADLQVVCERGIAFLDLPGSLVWFDDAGQHTESLQDERPVGEQLLMQFHRSVSSLVLKSSSLEDTFRALQIVLKASQSAVDGQRLAL
ncbi:MAG: Gfo/Idh/MocA family oxidoreductase [Planctomycetota bacterium]